MTANRALYTEYYKNRFCMDENEEQFLKIAINRVAKGKIKDSVNFLAIVRDPLDRFVSAFVDKCVIENKDILVDFAKHCYNCGKNISCFVSRQYQRAFGYTKGRVPGVGYEDIHTYPQSWHCNFQRMFENYTIIKYAAKAEDKNRMNRQILEALRNFDVKQEKRAYISRQMSKHSLHQTAANPERAKYEAMLLSDPQAMKTFLKLYYYDYVLFGFDLPCVSISLDKDKT
ncbi:hypothetical protein WR25_18981 [Diploscapter pachys]|uniref:Sulfotransferase domain-containing protein n=1 Tax=Diploscapter pachys TaxID=2018661 RepID=A0A2A2LZX3_9BILA|nr:hypothetical protein WR25_18981 [Diploscapter pachys]